jgi:hypothetical protein
MTEVEITEHALHRWRVIHVTKCWKAGGKQLSWGSLFCWDIPWVDMSPETLRKGKILILWNS